MSESYTKLYESYQNVETILSEMSHVCTPLASQHYLPISIVQLRNWTSKPHTSHTPFKKAFTDAGVVVAATNTVSGASIWKQMKN